MNPLLWGNSRALAVCMKDQSHKGPKPRRLGGCCLVRETVTRARRARALWKWKGRDGCEGQLQWFCKIWGMTKNEGRWRSPTYFRALELGDQEGWSTVLMTVHSPRQLKKPLYTVPQLTWWARGAHVGPGSCAVPTVLLAALASSLTQTRPRPYHLWVLSGDACTVVDGSGGQGGACGSQASTSGLILHIAHGRMRIHPHCFTTTNIPQSVYLVSLIWQCTQGQQESCQEIRQRISTEILSLIVLGELMIYHCSVA